MEQQREMEVRMRNSIPTQYKYTTGCAGYILPMGVFDHIDLNSNAQDKTNMLIASAIM
jgi:hypothetical protein